jgi:hypothetical protein
MKIALIFYILFLWYLISCYRKLNGVDEKSLDFQKKIDETIKKSALVKSRKDYRKLLLMGMVGGVFLIALTIWKK